MKALHLKRMIIATVACGVVAAVVGSLWARDDIAGQAKRVFDAAFASKLSDQIGNPILRVRTGFETFCIQEDTEAQFLASQLISDLSEAFDLSWTQIHVADLAECPTRGTTFFVVQGERPDQSDLLDVIKGISGSSPSNPDVIFPDWARGMSVSLPGSGNQEFVFASYSSDMPQDVARSILSEELLQSILRASDVETTEIISLLGEDIRNKDYAQWFHNNPIGFCSIDIVLLELLLGPSTSSLHKMDQMRAYLSSNFNDLFKAAGARAPALASYADPRCWLWEGS